MIGPSPRSRVANTKLAACRTSRPPWLLVRPCQPLVSRPGSPEWPAGTVDQVSGGGSDGCSVRGTIRIVPAPYEPAYVSPPDLKGPFDATSPLLVVTPQCE
jgi:hypothetical protein